MKIEMKELDEEKGASIRFKFEQRLVGQACAGRCQLYQRI